MSFGRLHSFLLDVTVLTDSLLLVLGSGVGPGPFFWR